MKKEEFKEELFDVEKARKGQLEYCEKNNAPHFANESGKCWACGRQIYKPVFWKRKGNCQFDIVNSYEECDFVTGITVEEASRELVTGCPHCNRSYCD